VLTRKRSRADGFDAAVLTRKRSRADGFDAEVLTRKRSRADGVDAAVLTRKRSRAEACVVQGVTFFGELLDFFEAQNNWIGWVIFLGVYCLNISLFLPGLVLILGAGFVFG
jgi:hypothetical protein